MESPIGDHCFDRHNIGEGNLKQVEAILEDDCLHHTDIEKENFKQMENLLDDCRLDALEDTSIQPKNSHNVEEKTCNQVDLLDERKTKYWENIVVGEDIGGKFKQVENLTEDDHIHHLDIEGNVEQAESSTEDDKEESSTEDDKDESSTEDDKEESSTEGDKEESSTEGDKEENWTEDDEESSTEDDEESWTEDDEESRKEIENLRNDRCLHTLRDPLDEANDLLSRVEDIRIQMSKHFDFLRDHCIRKAERFRCRNVVEDDRPRVRDPEDDAEIKEALRRLAIVKHLSKKNDALLNRVPELLEK